MSSCTNTGNEPMALKVLPSGKYKLKLKVSVFGAKTRNLNLSNKM